MRWLPLLTTNLTTSVTLINTTKEKNMLTLIKKEIQDSFAVLAVYAAVAICWLGYNYYFESLFRNYFDRILFTNISIGLALPAFAIFLGLVQSSNDVNCKYSAFLMSMPVTRRQLYLARIIAGGGSIAMLCLICLVLTLIETREAGYEDYIVLNSSLVFKWYVFVLLGALVSYGHGINLGGYKDFRLILSFIGSIGLFLLPIYVVYLKGMGMFAGVLLTVWAAGILYLGYEKFNNRPL